jgi:hypothetical protein
MRGGKGEGRDHEMVSTLLAREVYLQTLSLCQVRPMIPHTKLKIKMMRYTATQGLYLGQFG